MGTYFNKNSAYISSLTSFILDTKPYHSKLTEIVEEYQFFDEMSVKVTERNSLQTKIDPVWLYNYYSSGDPSFRSLPLKQLHSSLPSVFPLNADSTYPGAIRAFRDENTDLATMPFVFSKKAFDGIGVPNVYIERNGNRSTVEPMVEGLDYFQSHGAFQFQVKQTIEYGHANSDGTVYDGFQFVPSWTETRNENIISAASFYTKQVALDATYDTLTGTWVPNIVPNPVAAVHKIKALLLQIQALPITPASVLALNDLLVIVNTPALPRDYEPLLNQLAADGTAVLSPYTSWLGSTNLAVQEAFRRLTPAMYFNVFSDADVRESGQARYEDVRTDYLDVTNIVASSAAAAGDTWHLIAQDDPTLYSVFSNVDGYLGVFDSTVGNTFSSTTLSFMYTRFSTPAVGYNITIKNRNRLVFGPTAPLEVWNIVKVNPIAYTRPVFISSRYGFIRDQVGTIGHVTILDIGLPTSTVTLTARAGGQYFDLTSDVEPGYVGLVQVNIPYNDGRLAFTVATGSVQPYVQGDKFYIAIMNEPAKAIDLDLGYGYDLDSYDAQNLNYDPSTPGQKLNFAFDTRFTDYNLTNLNLVVAQNATSGLKWRITAVPDLARPVATIKKDGTTSNAVDVQALTDGVSPDPALNAAAVFETIGGVVNSLQDLKVYYATSFNVECSTDNFNTVTSVGSATVGAAFTSASYGISFTLAAGSKPFIAVLSDDGGVPVSGGDVFSFEVLNAPPVLVEEVIGEVSANVPRLTMHGDGFHEAPPANWTVTFTSATEYAVSGILTEGTPGFQVPNGPSTGSIVTSGAIANEGTFNGLGVHFTVVPGSVGFAAGDVFKFKTFSRKPSYLVHGSASGWQADAVVGEPYWNGYIGFTIQKPTAELFDQTRREMYDPMPAILAQDPNWLLTHAVIAPYLIDSPRIPATGETSWSLGAGTLELTRLRFDAPNLIYTLTPTPTSGTPTGWYVTRSDVGAVGHLSRTGSFTDTYITLTVTTEIPSSAVVKVELQITADDFDLWAGQDTVILRSAISARLPTSADYVLVDKRAEDRLALNLRYDAVGAPPSLAALAPYTIDQRFINLNTNNGQIPLSNTSPETAILTNWIPLTVKKYDSSTSIAEFADETITHVVYSAASGEPIGTLSPTTSNPWYPMEFKWFYDATSPTTITDSFFKKYLPLNAEANIVTYGSGFNEIVHARISETINFLVDGGPLLTDFMFHDDVHVHIDEYHDWAILMSEDIVVNTVVADDPFGGFLPGYDNLPYDFETGVGDINGTTGGLYDAGIPLTDNFMEARQLSGLDPMTAKQLSMTAAERVNRLNTLLGLIENFLNGSLAGTTLDQYLANVAADPIGATLASTGIGIPAVGMGMDITIGSAGVDVNNPSTETTGASVQDALVMMAIDPATTVDTFGYDVGRIDAIANRTAMVFTGGLPPVPNPLPVFTTYENFETPLSIVGDPSIPADFTARTFEFHFQVTAGNLATIQAMATPRVFIWFPTAAAPTQIAVVEKIGTGKYRVSLGSATEAKFYLQPGP
jgi:hypothetical protein